MSSSSSFRKASASPAPTAWSNRSTSRSTNASPDSGIGSPGVPTASRDAALGSAENRSTNVRPRSSSHADAPSRPRGARGAAPARRATARGRLGRYRRRRAGRSPPAGSRAPIVAPPRSTSSGKAAAGIERRQRLEERRPVRSAGVRRRLDRAPDDGFRGDLAAQVDEAGEGASRPPPPGRRTGRPPRSRGARRGRRRGAPCGEHDVRASRTRPRRTPRAAARARRRSEGRGGTPPPTPRGLSAPSRNAASAVAGARSSFTSSLAAARRGRPGDRGRRP